MWAWDEETGDVALKEVVETYVNETNELIHVFVNGEYVVVEKVQHEILEAPIAVYNFHVEDYHTYYVTDAGVLVHNMCANRRTSNPSKSESPVWRELDNYIKGTKTSGTGNDQRHYQWDYLHNEIEVYDKRGNHLGAMDPITGEFYKGFEAGRSIKL